jgi:hypothetical protein
VQIKLIDCNARLLALRIDMNDVGSYEILCNFLKLRMPFIGVEYDFPPLDYILIDVDEGTIIPDLSDLGEVIPYDSSAG